MPGWLTVVAQVNFAVLLGTTVVLVAIAARLYPRLAL
jgi:hypothetical protein